MYDVAKNLGGHRVNSQEVYQADEQAVQPIEVESEVETYEFQFEPADNFDPKKKTKK